MVASTLEQFVLTLCLASLPEHRDAMHVTEGLAAAGQDLLTVICDR